MASKGQIIGGGAALVAGGALVAGALVWGGGEGEPTAERMSAEACAPFQEGLQPVHNAELAVTVADQQLTAGTTPEAQKMSEADKLRAEATKKDAEASVVVAKENFIKPYKERVAAAQAAVDAATNTTTTEGAPAPSEGDKLRNEATKKDAEAALKTAQEEEDKAEKAAEDCDPAEGTTVTTQTITAAGLNPAGQETASHIAVEGSCSPYTHADGVKAANGEFPKPTDDLVDVQVAFLKNHPEFASTMATSWEARTVLPYDALNIPRPSANAEGAQKSIEAVVENDYYVTVPLAEATRVLNTYCDAAGNIVDYREVELEAGTYIGGMMIEEEGLNAANGNAAVKLKNGTVVELQANTLVVNVTLPDGSVGKAIALNKGGVNVDDDQSSEVSCWNPIFAVPPTIEVQVTPPGVGGPEGPRPSTPTATTTPRVTTTTIYVPPKNGEVTPDGVMTPPTVETPVPGPSNPTVVTVPTPETQPPNTEPESPQNPTTVVPPTAQPPIR